MNVQLAASDLACAPARVPLPYLINSVAVSDDAGRVVAGTFYYPYWGTVEKKTQGKFGIYAIDPATGARLWRAANPGEPNAPGEFDGSQGVYAVAVSGDGKVAAAGGLLTGQQGLLRAYDASNGDLLLDYQGVASQAPGQTRKLRFSSVALSKDGAILAAVADKVYLFARTAGGTFGAEPIAAISEQDAFNGDSLPMAVTVHSSGKWFAGCDKKGNVCMAKLDQGQMLPPLYRWRAPATPVDRSKVGSPTGPVMLLSIAAAGAADCFVTGGNDLIYYFSVDGMAANQKPLATFDTWDLIPPPQPKDGSALVSPPPNVRWVAISADGRMAATVVNRCRDGGRNGSLLALRREGANGLKLAWQRALNRNPNSVGLDAAGSFVVASDGYPFGTPGGFYGFRADGTPCWEYTTANMNWPIAISADGKGIWGGGDDGMIYHFNRRDPYNTLT